MTALNTSTAPVVSPGLSRGLKILADEVSSLLQALLYPGKILAEVDEMRRLLTAAHRADHTDPARAAALRARVARIGLN